MIQYLRNQTEKALSPFCLPVLSDPQNLSPEASAVAHEQARRPRVAGVAHRRSRRDALPRLPRAPSRGHPRRRRRARRTFSHRPAAARDAGCREGRGSRAPRLDQRGGRGAVQPPSARPGVRRGVRACANHDPRQVQQCTLLSTAVGAPRRNHAQSSRGATRDSKPRSSRAPTTCWPRREPKEAGSTRTAWAPRAGLEGG